MKFLFVPCQEQGQGHFVLQAFCMGQKHQYAVFKEEAGILCTLQALAFA